MIQWPVAGIEFEIPEEEDVVCVTNSTYEELIEKSSSKALRNEDTLNDYSFWNNLNRTKGAGLDCV